MSVNVHLRELQHFGCCSCYSVLMLMFPVGQVQRTVVLYSGAPNNTLFASKYI